MNKLNISLPKFRFDPKAMLPNAKNVARGTLMVNVLVAFGIFVALNLILKQVTLRYDLTSDKQNSLSEETLKLIQPIKQEVKVTVYTKASSYTKGEFEKLLEEYTLRNSNIKVEYVDLDRDIVRAKTDGVRKDGIAFVQVGESREEANTATETEITSAIFKALNPKKYQAVMWIGSGQKSAKNAEASVAGVDQILRQNNYVVTEKNEVNDPVIPEGTDLVVVLGPIRTLTSQAESNLLAYAQKGGKLFVAVDPLITHKIAAYGMEKVFDYFGVSVAQGLVFEPKTNYYQSPAIFGTDNYPSSQINEGLTGNAFLEAGAIKTVENLDSSITVSPIVKSSPEAWLETNLQQGSTSFNKDANELAGPLDIGVAVTRKISDQLSARLVLFSDSDFPLDAVVMYTGAPEQLYVPENVDLFIRSANWLVARENLYNIAPKEKKSSQVTLNNQQKQYANIGVLAVMPLLVFVLGIVIVRTRQSKSR